jgi:hypothetical protein
MVTGRKWAGEWSGGRNSNAQVTVGAGRRVGGGCSGAGGHGGCGGCGGRPKIGGGSEFKVVESCAVVCGRQ